MRWLDRWFKRGIARKMFTGVWTLCGLYLILLTWGRTRPREHKEPEPMIKPVVVELTRPPMPPKKVVSTPKSPPRPKRKTERRTVSKPKKVAPPRSRRASGDRSADRARRSVAEPAKTALQREQREFEQRKTLRVSQEQALRLTQVRLEARQLGYSHHRKGVPPIQVNINTYEYLSAAKFFGFVLVAFDQLAERYLCVVDPWSQAIIEQWEIDPNRFSPRARAVDIETFPYFAQLRDEVALRFRMSPLDVQLLFLVPNRSEAYMIGKEVFAAQRAGVPMEQVSLVQGEYYKAGERFILAIRWIVARGRRIPVMDPELEIAQGEM